MKNVLMITSLALSAGMAAAQVSTVTLRTGETATVIQTSGTNTAYVKSIKTVVEQDEVFNGVQIVKKGDGSCVKVENNLVSISTFNTSAGNIQLPKVDTKETVVSCPG